MKVLWCECVLQCECDQARYISPGAFRINSCHIHSHIDGGLTHRPNRRRLLSHDLLITFCRANIQIQPQIRDSGVAFVTQPTNNANNPHWGLISHYNGTKHTENTSIFHNKHTGVQERIAIFVFIFVHLFLGFCFGFHIRRSPSRCPALAPARFVYTYIVAHMCVCVCECECLYVRVLRR